MLYFNVKKYLKIILVGQNLLLLRRALYEWDAPAPGPCMPVLYVCMLVISNVCDETCYRAAGIRIISVRQNTSAGIYIYDNNTILYRRFFRFIYFFTEFITIITLYVCCDTRCGGGDASNNNNNNIIAVTYTHIIIFILYFYIRITDNFFFFFFFFSSLFMSK